MKPGTRIGRYVVARAVGRGDPDGLFDVLDEQNRRFAIRSPVGDLDDGDAVTRQLLPVAAALCTIAHLNLIVVFETFVERGQLYLLTERVSGRTLGAALDAGIGPRMALVLTRQILDAAICAHEAGQVHRDLRPSKILLVPMTSWELVKVADFGLGTIVDEAVLAFGAGALMGIVPKPAAHYMAPEQVLGRSVDARTDLYSIGVMLFEMLTQRLPFPDRDPELVRELHVRLPPPRLDEICRGAAWCTPEVLSLVEIALAKERGARFQTGREMLQAVDEAFMSLHHLPPE